MSKTLRFLPILILLPLLTACGQQQATTVVPPAPSSSSSVVATPDPTMVAQMTIDPQALASVHYEQGNSKAGNATASFKVPTNGFTVKGMCTGDLNTTLNLQIGVDNSAYTQSFPIICDGSMATARITNSVVKATMIANETAQVAYTGDTDKVTAFTAEIVSSQS